MSADRGVERRRVVGTGCRVTQLHMAPGRGLGVCPGAELLPGRADVHVGRCQASHRADEKGCCLHPATPEAKERALA